MAGFRVVVEKSAAFSASGCGYAELFGEGRLPFDGCGAVWHKDTMTTAFRPGAFVWLATLGFSFTTILPSDAGERTDRVTAIRLPTAGQPVKAQLGTDGTIHLLLDSTDGPLYVRSQDAGATFSAPIAVVDAASQKPDLKYHVEDLAVGQGGRVHAALANNAWKLKLPQEHWGLYYASLKPGAKAFSPVRNLNRKPSEGFSLAADDSGAVTAGFLSGKLFSMVSRDGGETFTASAELNPAWDPCDCCTTTAAYGADGRLALLYREQTNNERDMFVAVMDQRGAGQPVRTRISSTLWKLDACPMTYYAISRSGAGFVAAWPTKSQVYFARLDKDGAVLPPGEIKTPGTSGMRTGLLALSATDGATLVGWKNQDVLGWQLYDGQGKPLGAPGSAASPENGAAGVVLRDGRFLLFP